ncbi:MAG: hypothetical protein WBD78_14995 [Methylocella sp.]
MRAMMVSRRQIVRTMVVVWLRRVGAMVMSRVRRMRPMMMAVYLRPWPRETIVIEIAMRVAAGAVHTAIQRLIIRRRLKRREGQPRGRLARWEGPEEQTVREHDGGHGA